jgi:hypothetical protein
MFQKFLIDNAIKIFTTFVSLLVAAGIWIGRSEMEVSHFKKDLEEQKIVIKNYDRLINQHEFMVLNHDYRLDRLDNLSRK